MAVHCFSPILGKRLRITRLDECGNVPAIGTANSWIATDGFITVNLSSEIEDGAEIVQKNASGGLCVNEKLNNSFKRFNVELTLCGVNPSLLSFVTNAQTYADYAGDIAGFKIAEGAITNKFALELWTGLAGQACSNSNVASGYLLLPLVQAGQLGDIEVGGENAINMTMSGGYTIGDNNWGTGPYNVVYNASQVASKLPTALDDGDHLLLIDTALAYPPTACDPQPMPTDVTAPVGGTLTATGTGSTRTLTVAGASDAGAGLNATPYRFSWDNGVTYSAWQTAAAFTTPILTAGTYTAKAQIRDAAGIPNVTTITATNFTIT